MTVFQIDYDLQEPGQDYDDISDAISSLGDYTHILGSSWLVDVSGMKAKEVRDNLQESVDRNDKLLVTKISKKGQSWATSFGEGTDWLREHL